VVWTDSVQLHQPVKQIHTALNNFEGGSMISTSRILVAIGIGISGVIGSIAGLVYDASRLPRSMHDDILVPPACCSMTSKNVAGLFRLTPGTMADVPLHTPGNEDDKLQPLPGGEYLPSF
jgi:hypothetical protein